MGKYDSIGDARVMEGGVYFEPGLFLVKIMAVKEGKTRKGDEFFVVECQIEESTHSELVAGKNVSWMVMMKQDAALSNIKQFTAIAGGELLGEEVPYEAVDGKSVEKLLSTDNPLKGTLLGADVTEIETRAGKPFNKVVWKSVAKIKDMLAAYRAATAARTPAPAAKSPEKAA